MSSKTPVKIILGTHHIGDRTKEPLAAFDDLKDVQALLDVFYNRGYRHLDTGRNYGASEVRLGQVGAASRFIIDSKVLDGLPGSHEPAKIHESIKQTLENLKTSAVETMYLHVPDRQTPFEDTAKAINEDFLQGRFKKFGLSNYTPAEVKRFVDICEQNGPAAGGFFSDHVATSKRWSGDNDVARKYSALYGQPPVRAAVDTLEKAAKKHGISGHAAAIRWTAFHSALDGKYGDGLTFTVSTLAQVHGTLDALEAGPLPDEVADAISAIYATCEGSEPPFHL
ncbi:putative aldo keto protein [Phaeoacremonium minimum UCRPA7]|uniref:Putative aldo keto protein n=1 Tax=Phaeoacremonium minimum (strain UCR-PA7) TaxID=1286976 RepID=R8BCW5_PHAM7|nr:putative aldo keto protein [Phaeoacremonium minimum UCRPA7]EON97135.1 putative aldo keto protein [Phaeoacremonium minimum UCRPA7]